MNKSGKWLLPNKTSIFLWFIRECDGVERSEFFLLVYHYSPNFAPNVYETNAMHSIKMAHLMHSSYIFCLSLPSRSISIRHTRMLDIVRPSKSKLTARFLAHISQTLLCYFTCWELTFPPSPLPLNCCYYSIIVLNDWYRNWIFTYSHNKYRRVLCERCFLLGKTKKIEIIYVSYFPSNKLTFDR